MRSLAVAALAVIAALCLAPAAAHAQCTPALRGFQSGPVDVNPSSPAFIGAMTLFDDGGGGGPSLVAAGLFAMPPVTIGPVTNVCRYRNGVWSAMQTDLPQTSNMALRALAQADFSSVGGPGPSLYTAGDNGVIYRWAATHWVTTSGTQGPCYTLLAYSDAQGPVLLAGGSFGVLAWRGSGTWLPYAPLNPSGIVFHLRVVDDGSGPALFAIGSFRDTSRNINCIAKHANGQWLPYPVDVVNVQSFSDFTSFDDGVNGPELFISGSFSTHTTPNAGVARLHGGAWNIVGTSLNVDGSALGPTFFMVDEGQGQRLYVGGVFATTGQNSGLVRLVNTPAPGWEAPAFLTRLTGSPSGAVHSLARFDDGAGVRTYFGGVFSSFRTDPAPTAASSEAFGLIRGIDPASTSFESTAQGLGELITVPSPTFRYTLSTIDMGQGTRLFASAPFVRAGGRLARGAVLYDGAAWSPLSLPANGSPSQCIQFGVMANIGGQQRLVSNIFNSPLGPISYWDGTQWVHLTQQPGATVFYGLAVLNGALYALADPGLFRYTGSSWVNDIPGSAGGCSMIVGDFGRGRRLYLTISGPMGPGLYEYDGTTYSRLGTTFSTNPSSLAIHDDGAGPAIYVASGGLLSRFQNNGFTPITTSFSMTGSSALSMASFHDGVSPALYIAGPFVNVGGMQTNGFVRWHAGAFTNVLPFAPGLNPQGLGRASLAVHGNRLYIAGEFYNIGSTAADHLAYIEACPRVCSPDFNHDGDSGTDADIEAFFACLAGTCCPNCDPSDYNGDGDSGTDADIESFFRVLAGGPC